jgi:hypothetical protein
VAAVTIDRIAATRADITNAVNKAAASNPASRQEADEALVGACREACGLLTDWLADGDWWHGLRPTDGTLADAIPDQDDFMQFLSPTFRDAIGILARHGMSVHDGYVDEARRAVKETARHYGKGRREALLGQARGRVEDLRREVCALANDLTTSAVRRRRAISLPKRTAKVLASVALQIALTLTVTTQHEISHDISVWAHDAVSVLVVHQIAHEAEPNLSIGPSGPELEMEPG